MKLLILLGIFGVSIGQAQLLSEIEDALSSGARLLKDKLQPHTYSLSAFHDFMSVHNKSYSSREEYKARYNIFRSNMKVVEKLNAMERGTAVYGATHLADLSPEEFRRDYLGYNKVTDDPDIHWPPADIPDIDLPESWDWREKGAVTEVKNQGNTNHMKHHWPKNQIHSFSRFLWIMLGFQHHRQC